MGLELKTPRSLIKDLRLFHTSSCCGVSLYYLRASIQVGRENMTHFSPRVVLEEDNSITCLARTCFGVCA
jgi:hypothetical protein